MRIESADSVERIAARGRRSERHLNATVPLVRCKLWARGGATVNSALRHLSVVCLLAAGARHKRAASIKTQQCSRVLSCRYKNRARLNVNPFAAGTFAIRRTSISGVKSWLLQWPK